MKANECGEEIISLAVDAVDRLLIRVGYSGMSMEDVANESRIERQTLYLYFRNKGDLVLAREDRITKTVREALQRVAEKSGSWEGKIRKMLYLRVLLRFDSVQHIPESLDDILRDVGPDLRDREELYCKQESKILSGVLQRGRRSATLQSQACSTLADALIAATNSLLPFHLTRNDVLKRRDAEEKAEQIIDIVLHGLSGSHGVTEAKGQISQESSRSESRKQKPGQVALHRTKAPQRRSHSLNACHSC